jgi:hypothetical protein
MGIEPTRAAPPEQENKRFGAMANPKCDGRVNFRGMWGRKTPSAPDLSLSRDYVRRHPLAI